MERETDETGEPRSAVRQRAAAIKGYRCRNLIAVIENPKEIRNVGTVVRNVEALGVEKTYVIDPKGALADDWHVMRDRGKLASISAGAVKWSFVRRFDGTADCLAHLASKNFTSVVTSPHVRGKHNAVLDETDFTAYAKLAVWFGNEALGVSEEAIAAADLCVSIPMFGMVESLNLGTTSGIVLHEVTRQRRAYQARFRKRNRRVPVAPA